MEKMKKDQYVENESLKEQAGAISNVFVEDFILDKDDVQKLLDSRGVMEPDEIIKFCESCGFENYLHSCVVTGRAFEIFAKACVKREKGTVTVSYLFEKMLRWCNEVTAKDAFTDDEDKQAVFEFLDLCEENRPADMKSFLIAALAVAGYDVRVVSVFVFTVVEVRGIRLV